MSAIGDCFVILNPDSSEDSVIFGRNSLQDNGNKGVAQEVLYIDANGSSNEETVEKFRMILQKPCPGIWGGECGSNEKISIGVLWVSAPITEESKDNNYSVTDIVRLTLATTESAEEAVEHIGQLVVKHSRDDFKFSLLVCDAGAAWIVNVCGKLWAAQCLSKGFHRLPSNGLGIRTNFNKSSKNLIEELKSINRFNEGEMDFAACCNAIGDLEANWCGNELHDGGDFTLTHMFNTLRSAAGNMETRSATVFVWKKNGISSHWFTATPNVNESVFKPFIFSPNPKISPLTKVQPGEKETLLHKLHVHRKPIAIEHLKALETSCVEEISRYLKENISNNELDELMKDCVEAEVKFYR